MMIQNLDPVSAWQYFQHHKNAVLIDVRSKIEHSFIGHPIGAVHVVWREFPAWQIDPHFVANVMHVVPDKKTPLILICRSGQRSLEASKELEKAGYTQIINVLEGFEGALDRNEHRGNISGWRFHNLPWKQT